MGCSSSDPSKKYDIEKTEIIEIVLDERKRDNSFPPGEIYFIRRKENKDVT